MHVPFTWNIGIANANALDQFEIVVLHVYLREIAVLVSSSRAFEHFKCHFPRVLKIIDRRKQGFTVQRFVMYVLALIISRRVSCKLVPI
jgi:hypothetical protein